MKVEYKRDGIWHVYFIDVVVEHRCGRRKAYAVKDTAESAKKDDTWAKLELIADVAMPEERDLVLKILERMGDPVGIASDHLAATDLPERLAFAARNRYARICQLMEGALQEALHWKKARLTTGHFAVAFERRSLVYGQDERNPFLAEHWRHLRSNSFLTIDDAPAQSS